MKKLKEMLSNKVHVPSKWQLTTLIKRSKATNTGTDQMKLHNYMTRLNFVEIKPNKSVGLTKQKSALYKRLKLVFKN